MKKQIIYIFSILFLGISSNCNSENDTQKEIKDQNKLLAELFNTDNLNSQIYQINPNQDTLLKGADGTIIRIYKNTFVDADGNLIKEPIEVELKEAINSFDIVRSNLSTTSNGQKLQTGGMIFLDAKCSDKQVRISESKSIGIIIPREEKVEDMKVFMGEKTESGINWVDPKPTLSEELERLEEIKNAPKRIEKPKVELKINNIKAKNSIDAIFDFVDSDTIGKLEGDVANENVVVAAVAVAANAFGQFTSELSEKGQNFFSVDYGTSYIFELKKLGWANIDRLYSDPRTKPVELITKITNSKEFKSVYITMVISKMYLPGYEMKDGSFSFTHNDIEKPSFPIGEKAIIFATAYKDNEPYFDIITTTIKLKENVSLSLKRTSKNELESKLKKML